MRFEEDELEELARRIADRLLDHLPNVVPEAEAISDDGEIMGIDPNALYSVQFVADRWDKSDDTVYRLSNEELPRADWHGNGVRFRGIDILQFEGVDVRPYSSDSENEDISSNESTGEDGESIYPGNLPEL